MLYTGKTNKPASDETGLEQKNEKLHSSMKKLYLNFEYPVERGFSCTPEL